MPHPAPLHPLQAFKCGRVCFFCGMPDTTQQGVALAEANISPLDALKSNELTPLKNTWALGSCNMGACDSFVILKPGMPGYENCM